jgi:hypothetical protein
VLRQAPGELDFVLVANAYVPGVVRVLDQAGNPELDLQGDTVNAWVLEFSARRSRLGGTVLAVVLVDASTGRVAAATVLEHYGPTDSPSTGASDGAGQ